MMKKDISTQTAELSFSDQQIQVNMSDVSCMDNKLLSKPSKKIINIVNAACYDDESNESSEFNTDYDCVDTLDASFHISQEDESEDSDVKTESYVLESFTWSAFVVFWSSLVILLQRCLLCSALASIIKVTKTGSAEK